MNENEREKQRAKESSSGSFTGNDGQSMTLSPVQLAGQILTNSCPESGVGASHSPFSVPLEIASKL